MSSPCGQAASARRKARRPALVSISAFVLAAAGLLVCRVGEPAFAALENLSATSTPLVALVKPLRAIAKHRKADAGLPSAASKVRHAPFVTATVTTIEKPHVSMRANVDPSRNTRNSLPAVIESTPIVKVDMKLRDRNLDAHPAGAAAGGFISRLGAEQSSVQEVRVKATALDNRVALTMTESRSLYYAASDYLRAVTRSGVNPKFMGKERFLFLENNEGFAGRERLEVTLFRQGAAAASVFATNTHVDAAYYTPPTAGRDGIAPPHAAAGGFRLRDRSSAAGGVQLRYGAFSLTSSYWRGNVADRIAEHAETRVEHALAWNMSDDPVLAAALPASLIALVPSSLHVGVVNANANAPILTRGARDRTKSVVAGAEWEADNVSLSVDYYSYRTVSEGAATGPATSNGSGVSADARFDFAPFFLRASASYSPGRDSAQDYGAKSKTYSVSASLTYKSEQFPDVFVDANVGRYVYREGGDGWEGASHSKYWDATVGLDFAKFFIAEAGRDTQRTRLSSRIDLKSLKLFYRYDYFSDAVSYGASAPNRSVIGASLTASLY